MPSSKQSSTVLTRRKCWDSVDPDQIDWRQQLFNKQECGPVTRVSLPAEAITSLHGILFDIDPRLFRSEVASDEVRSSPAKFYEQVVAPRLARHPALEGAEVIDSGRGLHVIPRFESPVEFVTDTDRRRWHAIIRVVQRALPTDPCAPGITALTRPVGSVNAKNGATVKRLRVATPISTAPVLALYEQMRARPFATVMHILCGNTRVSPCPICAREGSVLSAFDHAGSCYGGCGRPKLPKLYGAFLASPTVSSKIATGIREQNHVGSDAALGELDEHRGAAHSQT
jgi:hypothetical protein